MAIHRMRTVQEALTEIQAADAGTAITANCIRTLCKNKQVRCIYTGNKILVDMDDLLAFLCGKDDRDENTVTAED